MCVVRQYILFFLFLNFIMLKIYLLKKIKKKLYKKLTIFYSTRTTAINQKKKWPHKIRSFHRYKHVEFWLTWIFSADILISLCSIIFFGLLFEIKKNKIEKVYLFILYCYKICFFVEKIKYFIGPRPRADKTILWGNQKTIVFKQKSS